MVATSFCAIVREHVLSQQYLLAVGHDITAMTLVRPAFEALVRAVWAFKGAKDGWIEAFLSPNAAGLDAGNETIKGTDVDAMLHTIEKNHPAHVFSSLKTLKDATWIPMHSYVHGGIRPVVQALAGCPEPQQIAIVLNGNAFALMATNVMMMATGAVGDLAQIPQRHLACLPPMTPVAQSA